MIFSLTNLLKFYPNTFMEYLSSGAAEIDKTSVFYIAVGVACSTILIIAIAVATLHVQSMPKNVDPGKEFKDYMSQR